MTEVLLPVPPLVIGRTPPMLARLRLPSTTSSEMLPPTPLPSDTAILLALPGTTLRVITVPALSLTRMPLVPRLPIDVRIGLESWNAELSRPSSVSASMVDEVPVRGTQFCAD